MRKKNWEKKKYHVSNIKKKKMLIWQLQITKIGYGY